MQEVFAIALSAMQQDMSRLDRVALNLANVTTPGYRREVVASQPFVQVLDTAAQSWGTSEATSRVTGPSNQTADSSQVFTDVRPGTIKATGQPFDVALLGDGFFEVITDGGPAYTRQGNFHLDARGRLVTAQGDVVMGRDGEIQLTTRTPVIDAAGKITDPNAAADSPAAASVAQLKVVRFDNPKTLRRLGDGLMASGSGMTVLGDEQAQVRQGALENANVSPMQEMVQLIQIMRHFESMQKIAQGYDEMLGSAVRKLGDLT